MTALESLTAALVAHFGRKGGERARILLHDLVKAGTPLLDVDAYEEYGRQWIERRPASATTAFGDAIRAGQRANLKQLAAAAEAAKDEKHQRDAKRDLFGVRIERPQVPSKRCAICRRWHAPGALREYVPGDGAVCEDCFDKHYEEIPPTPEATT